MYETAMCPIFPAGVSILKIVPYPAGHLDSDGHILYSGQDRIPDKGYRPQAIVLLWKGMTL